MDYDTWLATDSREKSAAEERAYEVFCEENELDLEEDHWDKFEDMMADLAEDIEIDRAESARDW